MGCCSSAILRNLAVAAGPSEGGNVFSDGSSGKIIIGVQKNSRKSVVRIVESPDIESASNANEFLKTEEKDVEGRKLDVNETEDAKKNIEIESHRHDVNETEDAKTNDEIESYRHDLSETEDAKKDVQLVSNRRDMNETEDETKKVEIERNRHDANETENAKTNVEIESHRHDVNETEDAKKNVEIESNRHDVNETEDEKKNVKINSHRHDMNETEDAKKDVQLESHNDEENIRDRTKGKNVQFDFTDIDAHALKERDYYSKMGCSSSVSVENDGRVKNKLDRRNDSATKSYRDDSKWANNHEKDASDQGTVGRNEISTKRSHKSKTASIKKENERFAVENGNGDSTNDPNKTLLDENKDEKKTRKVRAKENNFQFDITEIDAHALQAPKHVCGSTKDLADYLMRGATNQLYIARAFYRWITENIRYDTESFFGNNKKAVDAQSVLRLGTAVCAGYANLFEELCLHAGIKVKVISGYSKGYGYDPETPFSYKYKTDHAWNAININNKWQFVECTWGAGHVDKQGNFQKEFDDFFFLTDPKHFISDHFPFIDHDIESSKQWQLLDPPFTLEEFSTAVKLSRHARTWGLTFSRNEAVIVVDKTLELEIEDPRGILIDSMMHLSSSEGHNCDEYIFFRRIRPNIFKVTIRLPNRGSFKLDIFGKVDSRKGTLDKLVMFCLKCTSVASKVHPYPNHSGLWGVDSKAYEIGFKPSIGYQLCHKAINGELSLDLPADNVPPSLLHLTGTSSEENLNRFCLLETKSNGLKVHIRLPRQEFYKLEIYCKTDDSKSYHPVMSFLIDGFHGKPEQALPFPKTFPHTQEYLCELLEPSIGSLPANTPITIRFRSPKLVKGFVKCTDYTNLKNTDNVWVAEVTTSETGGVLSVNGNNSGEKSCWTLYTFQIV